MSEREMISRSHPENEAIRRETVKLQQRENDALRAKNEKLRLEIDMQQATILVPSQKDDQRRIERLDAALKEALDEAARLRAENEKLREALAAERERCARVAEQARDDTCDGPVAWSMADCIAAAIRESGE